MIRPKLILDTSACSRIATSAQRSVIESHLDSRFRRVLSVQTLWELLQQIEGGDGSHFSDDKEVLKVAAGTSRPPIMLPNPLSYAIETVLKLPRPPVPLPPRIFKQTYDLIMKARSRDELYSGVPVIRGLKQIRQFAPEIVRNQQEEGEQGHVERLKWAKRRKLPPLSPVEWAKAIMRQVQISLDDRQASSLANALDSTYRFDTHVWNMAIAPNSNYNPEKHRNDWSDMQQTIYLCDPSIHLIAADKALCQKISASHQANRVHHLPDYFAKNGLSL
jgi:hypothetical protein